MTFCFAIASSVLAATLAAPPPTPTPAAAGPSQSLHVEKLSDGVWAAQPERGANVGWFLLGDGVVAVDSGNDTDTAEAILKSIAETTGGKPVRFLVLTHSHGDHSRGARAFAAAGATIICHQNVAGSLVAFVTQPSSDPSDPLARKAGTKPVVQSVSEREFLLDGARTAEIDFLGAAHTSADLVVYLTQEKVLFAGDLASNGRLPDMKSVDADPLGWDRALQNLSRVGVQKMVPGHGAIGPATGITDSLAYVHRVNELSKKFLDAKVTDEMIPSQVRAPENVIEHVPATAMDSHIANVRAVMRDLRDKAQKPAPTPPPTPGKTSPS